MNKCLNLPLALLGCLAATGCNLPADAPDLRVSTTPVVPLGGSSQCERSDHLTIQNVGRRPAYAVVLVQTGPGPDSIQQVRLQPGPAAGESLSTMVCWPPDSRPPRCVEARLQRFQDTDPPDANPGDNQWCAAMATAGR